MSSTQRGCRCNRETYVAFKKVDHRPILFSQLKRRDGEGAINPEELFADDRPFHSEEERKREDELRALMSSIIDWAISFLSETNQASVRAVFYEGKTVKEHSADEVVTVYAVYKHLDRSYPVMRCACGRRLPALNPQARRGPTGAPLDAQRQHSGLPRPHDGRHNPLSGHLRAGGPLLDSVERRGPSDPLPLYAGAFGRCRRTRHRGFEEVACR